MPKTNKNAKVVSIRSRTRRATPTLRPIRSLSERRNVVVLADAMSEAIYVLGGRATIKSVCSFIEKFYGFREWKKSTITSYFYYMSKPQRFARVDRGVYSNTMDANTWDIAWSLKQKVAA